MNFKTQALFFLFLTLTAHILLFLFKNQSGFDLNNPNLQQDNYLGYVLALQSDDFPKNFSTYDSKIFPGLPITICSFNFFTANPIIAATLVSLLSLVVFYLSTLFLAKKPFFAFWITVFPPAIFTLTSKISSELLALAIISTALLFLHRQKVFLAAIFTGLAAIVHPIFAILLPLLIIYLIFREHAKVATILTFIFLLLSAAGTIVNQYIWPKLDFIPRLQFSLSEKAGVNLFVNQLKTGNLESTPEEVLGLLSILLAFFLAILILRSKENFVFEKDSFLFQTWLILSFLFIFLIAPIESTLDLTRPFSLLTTCSLLVLSKNLAKSKPVFILTIFLSILAFL